MAPLMTLARDEGLAGAHLPPFTALLAVSLLGVLASLLALCATCRRKGRKKKALQDGVKLVDASLLRQMQLRSLSKSDTKLHELNRVKPKEENQRPISLDFLYPSSEEAGTVRSSSLCVVFHRELPQPPAADPLGPDQTYSNLNFPTLEQEALYECVVVKQEEQQPNPAPEDTAPAGKEDQAVTAEYACVRKVKRNRDQPGQPQDGAEGGASLATNTLGLAEADCNRPLVQVEEMYSTVCKAGKKKAEGSSPSPSDGVTGHAKGSLAAGHQEVSGAAGHELTPAQVLFVEPCYESISDLAWPAHRRSPVLEPVHEAVGINWKQSRRRCQSSQSCPTENFYESVSKMWEAQSNAATLEARDTDL